MHNTMLVSTGSGPSLTSASGKRMLAIARGLSEQGIRVLWLCPHEEARADISRDPRYAKISFVCLLNRSRKIRKGRIVSYLLRLMSLCKLKQRIEAMQIEKTHSACFTVGEDALFLSLLLKRIHGLGVKVFHERTEYPHLGSGKSLARKLNLKLYYKFFVSKVDHLFVISTALQSHFYEYLQSRKLLTPVSILNMMVEPECYVSAASEKQNINSGEQNIRNIAYVGTMYGDKDGVYILIEAFLSIRREYPDIRLVLVGDYQKTERMQKILKLVDPADPDSGVIFTGQLDQAGVTRYLNSSYCLALARPDNIQAKYGFPTKLGEYLASGKPVVVTKVGDIPRFLIDGVNSYLAEPDNVESFAHKLRDCLDDPERAREIGAEGRKLVDTVFNYKECVKTVLMAMQSGEITA